MKELRETIVVKLNSFNTVSGQAVLGNKAAGRRSRALSNEITKLLKQWRAESIAAEKVSKP